MTQFPQYLANTHTENTIYRDSLLCTFANFANLFCYEYVGNLVLTSAWTKYSKLENSTSFNPQNSKSAKVKREKTWNTRITRAKTQNTRAKVELGTVWNSIKLQLDKSELELAVLNTWMNHNLPAIKLTSFLYICTIILLLFHSKALIHLGTVAILQFIKKMLHCGVFSLVFKM